MLVSFLDVSSRALVNGCYSLDLQLGTDVEIIGQI